MGFKRKYYARTTQFKEINRFCNHIVHPPLWKKWYGETMTSWILLSPAVSRQKCGCFKLLDKVNKTSCMTHSLYLLITTGKINLRRYNILSHSCLLLIIFYDGQIVRYFTGRCNYTQVGENEIYRMTIQESIPVHPAGTSVNSAILENCSKSCLVHYNVSQWEFQISHYLGSTNIFIQNILLWKHAH